MQKNHFMFLSIMLCAWACSTPHANRTSQLDSASNESCSSETRWYCVVPSAAGGWESQQGKIGDNVSNYYCDAQQKIQTCSAGCYVNAAGSDDDCRQNSSPVGNRISSAAPANVGGVAFDGVQVASYFADNSALQGGFHDRHGKCLQSTADYLAGRSTYVSIAMDYLEQSLIPEYSVVLIPSVGELLGDRNMKFCKVDTGGAFVGYGTKRLDICAPDRATALHTIGTRPNQTIYKIDENCKEWNQALPNCE